MKGADEIFEGGVLGVKVTIVILLFVLSMVNAYTKFISSSPRKFLAEAALVGIASALSFAGIGLIRQVPVMNLLSIATIAFLVFFVFHLFMEMSGMNQGAIDKSKLGGKMQKQQQILTSIPVKVIIVIIGGILFLAAAINHDFKDQYGYDLSPTQLSLEAILFGVLNALPTVMIMLDRGEKNLVKIAKDTGLMGAAFAVGHVLLQAGGVYTVAFR